MTQTDSQEIQNQDLLTTTLSQNQVKVEFNEARARELLDHIISRPLLVIDHDEVMNKARNFVSNWFIQEAARSYPMISSEVFERKRKISYGTRILEIPLLFKIPLNEIKGKGHSVLQVDNKGFDYAQYHIQAETPELTTEVREAYIKALFFNADLTKRAYTDPLIQKILATDRTFKSPYDAEFSIIWAPEKVEVNKVTPVPRDPALIMSYTQYAYFCIHKWDIPGEYPLEAMLKEFITSFPQATVSKQDRVEDIPF